MRWTFALALFVFAACSDPLGPLFGERWTMQAEATDCWPAFSVVFALDAEGIGEWGGGGRVVADSSTPTEVRFFPASGGYGADYVRGTFTDPHGVLTEGGSCTAGATLEQL